MTASEIVPKGGVSEAQGIVNEVTILGPIRTESSYILIGLRS